MSEIEIDPIAERCIAAVLKKAEELGVALEGRVTVRPTGRGGKSYEVYAGRTKLGTLSHDEFVRADVENLFWLRRSIWLWASPTDVDGVRQDWATWSRPLFALRWALGGLMDAALDEMRLASRQLTEESKPARTIAYQIIKSEEHQGKIREKAAKRYARTKSEADLACQQFSLSGGTTSAAGDIVMSAFKRWGAGEIGYPSWAGPNSVIPIRGAELSLRSESYQDDGKERQRAVVSMRILADKNPITGEHQAKTECYVRVHGDNDHATLRRLLRGEYRLGDGKLIWDIKKKSWKISVSYAMPRQAPKSAGTGYLAVRRSVHDLLFAMNSNGEPFRDCQAVGLKLIHLRGQFTRRKAECRKVQSVQGDGAKGHGKKRFFRLYGKLQDKEANSVDTALKQLASAIRKAAETSQARVVFVEDFSVPWNPVGGDPRFIKLLKRMPWAKAEGILKTELDQHGIQLRKTARAHDVTTCPDCGGKTEFIEADDLVQCECGLLCQRQFVSAWRMFVTEGVPRDALVEAARKASYISRAIRQRRLADAERAVREATPPIREVAPPPAAE